MKGKLTINKEPIKRIEIGPNLNFDFDNTPKDVEVYFMGTKIGNKKEALEFFEKLKAGEWEKAARQTLVDMAQKQIDELKHELAVRDRALELACDEVSISYEFDCPNKDKNLGCPIESIHRTEQFCFECVKGFKIKEYLDEARKELEDNNG